jgi:hypothetical protein
MNDLERPPREVFFEPLTDRKRRPWTVALVLLISAALTALAAVANQQGSAAMAWARLEILYQATAALGGNESEFKAAQKVHADLLKETEWRTEQTLLAERKSRGLWFFWLTSSFQTPNVEGLLRPAAREFAKPTRTAAEAEQAISKGSKCLFAAAQTISNSPSGKVNPLSRSQISLSREDLENFEKLHLAFTNALEKFKEAESQSACFDAQKSAFQEGAFVFGRMPEIQKTGKIGLVDEFTRKMDDLKSAMAAYGAQGYASDIERQKAAILAMQKVVKNPETNFSEVESALSGSPPVVAPITPTDPGISH